MTIEIIELRKGDRFRTTEHVTGTFGPVDVVIVDLSLGGAQLSHPQPLRIGTRAKLSFKRGDITATVPAHVIWSHLSKTNGGMSYVSGLQLDAVDPQYGMALNSLLRAGVLRKDSESMDKKKERMIEREAQRKSQQPRIIPTAGGVE
ncbi:MAG TPA: PilZ domain-containing protein [Thermoanaerobaculia bacterium]|nr:PilZ domain-containing protein [Thermoanaerobaculia bacterium]